MQFVDSITSLKSDEKEVVAHGIGSSIPLVDVSGKEVVACGTPPINRLAAGAVLRNESSGQEKDNGVALFVTCIH